MSYPAQYSAVYSLFVNRLHFLTSASHALSLHSVNATRASLCEIVGMSYRNLFPISCRLQLATCIIRRIEDEAAIDSAADVKNLQLLRLANVLARKSAKSRSDTVYEYALISAATVFLLFKVLPMLSYQRVSAAPKAQQSPTLNIVLSHKRVTPRRWS